MSKKRRFKIVVCGTRFGQAWIDGLVRNPRKYDLAAVLARGSEHSVRICRDYGVKLLNTISQVEGRVDAAVIAVGGIDGEKLADSCLKRGVPVLLEHPVRHQYLVKIQRRKQSVPLHVNGHFIELPAVRSFLSHCAKARKKNHPANVTIAATWRTLYSCIDIAAGLLTPEERKRVRSCKLHKNENDWPEFNIGPLRLKILLTETSRGKDDIADNLGGHYVRIDLERQSLTLVAATGPAFVQKAGNDSSRTWKIIGGKVGAAWHELTLKHRPAALLKALDRVIGETREEHDRALVQAAIVSQVWTKMCQRRRPI